MRKYLATLHKRSAHHKKRFALLVSGGFTLFIFAIWSLATFGTGGTLAQKEDNLNPKDVQEVSPFESLRAGVGESLESLRGNVLNIYGR